MVEPGDVKDISKCIALASISFYDNAILCFRNFKPGDKDYLAAVYGLATCYFFKKEFENAEKAYSTYLSYNPSHKIAWYYLGVTRFYLHRYKDSIAALEKASSNNPNYPHTYLMLMTNYLFLDDLDSASVNFKIAIEKSPPAVVSFLETFEEVIVKPSNIDEHRKLEIYRQIDTVKLLLSYIPKKLR